jgi:hypothetical protein
MSVGQSAVRLAGGTATGAAGGAVEVAERPVVGVVDTAVLVVEQGLDEGGMTVEHGEWPLGDIEVMSP